MVCADAKHYASSLCPSSGAAQHTTVAFAFYFNPAHDTSEPGADAENDAARTVSLSETPIPQSPAPTILLTSQLL